jgi:hypothetical protein
VTTNNLPIFQHLTPILSYPQSLLPEDIDGNFHPNPHTPTRCFVDPCLGDAGAEVGQGIHAHSARLHWCSADSSTALIDAQFRRDHGGENSGQHDGAAAPFETRNAGQEVDIELEALERGGWAQAGASFEALVAGSSGEGFG